MAFLGGGAMALGFGSPASAATTIRLGSTPQPGPAGCFVAADTGIFAANGISYEHLLIGLDPNVPPALLAGSIDIGVCTVSTILQAAENGLDIVIVGGAAVSNKNKPDYGIVVRKGGGVSRVEDLAGKTIGVPGLGAVFDVILRAWLSQKGIDVKKVKIVEATFPTQLDQIKAGTLDAAISSIPFMTNIINSGVGEILALLPAELPDNLPLNLYVTKREWAQNNSELLAAFRKSMKEGVSKGQADPTQLRASIGKYLKLTPEVLANFGLPTLSPEISEVGFNWWMAEMKRQGRISKIAVADVIWP
ncbi:ABC transporter substrate-binding protein [Agrobacterium vitis]|uniref:ABC transporter substrate-binding protein n=2 Tax=Agrobacterium vitis TaxID=373 RepID=A0AAE2UTY9_AGRVI|nr:ABC transporter substrate-binding protein [Agrobacterium vitis]MBF2714140.1 ABC transporter substrate-binding protein [Agrobacterium vitis]NSY15510.1 ABC transporter substrate-binding protein [Agrobacterium vitis]NSY25267.1 ABC transporter substrate-binding protein [Agrobacterium vitis]WEO74966.1 ABC transporter substrate-binding protein [Agrobacterium vitis]